MLRQPARPAPPEGMIVVHLPPRSPSPPVSLSSPPSPFRLPAARPARPQGPPASRLRPESSSPKVETSVVATGGRHFHTGLQRTLTASRSTATTTTPGSSSPQEEAGVETTGGRHHNPGREEDATTPVEEGARSTGRIGNSTHPTSTGSTPPDSPSSTTLILESTNSSSIAHASPASETSATGGDDRGPSSSEESIPSGEPFTTTLPLHTPSSETGEVQPPG
ncbi:mucin-2-like [Crassostrea angulata]|uniref:mucin-2-like n=1 Tax=Magallana angulata TaxID=2784310 RepID=UPI0022B0C5AE|nr:mucin-2-like [Crassostrea angulata]